MNSVVIAAYNGEKYIREQIKSILPQLGRNDEIIVSDDNPDGKTKDIVYEMMSQDSRITYIKGPKKGVVLNFRYAINKSHGDKIYLCDQDDVWLDEKIKICTSEFKKGALLICHNAYVTDENLNITDYSFFNIRNSGPGVLKNIVKNTYMGCCMAFDRKLWNKIGSIPAHIPMHDQWIGVLGEFYSKMKFHKKAVFIDTPLIYYRVHGGNVTAGREPASFSKKLNWRMYLIRHMLKKIFLGKV